ncbi:MAG TPA: AAA family ATPase [bacterium]|nr:AAA family ATPase [bacterium]
MYLEKLEIQGFKSFANKNKLVFSGMLEGQKRGITVVVGPNGSGKSNIADSIRWVLGEQSTKLLRSKKSEDVIFSGSDKKGRLNMAEVSLYLNNENSDLFNKRRLSSFGSDNLSGDNLANELVTEDSIEADNKKNTNKESDSVDALLMLPEIVLTRRVFRDGNSEYFINNNRVRLGDVQIFLAKANFGQKTYSVIGQGMVENFLNTSPAERKSFFDEATGVKQYQIKRDLSLNKLEVSQENLSKVEMLLSEIDPRLKSLTRQVGKLKKRQFLEEDLLKNQLNYYSNIWQEIDSRVKKFNENILELSQSKNSLEKSLEDNKKQMEVLNQGETIGEEFYDLQKRFLFLQSEKERAQKQLERISLFKKTKLENINEEDEKNLAILSQERTELLSGIEGFSKRLEEINTSFLGQNELEDLDKELNKLSQIRQEKHRELSKIEAWIEIRLEKQGRFDLSFLNSRQSEISEDISQIKKDSETLIGEIDIKKDKIEQIKLAEESISLEISKLEKELSRINIEESPSNIQKINQELKELLRKIENNDILSDQNIFKKIISEISQSIKELLDFSSGKNYQYQLENINNKISELKEQRNKLLQELSGLQVEHNSEKNKINELSNNLNRKNRELVEVLEKIKLNQGDDNVEENQNKKHDIEEELKNIDRKMAETQKAFIDIKNSKEAWQKNKSECQEGLQNFRQKLSLVDGKINEVKTYSIKIQSRLEDLLEDIKNNIFSEKESFEDDYSGEIKFIEDFLSKNEAESLVLKTKIDNFNQEQENKKRVLVDLQKSINELENDINKVNNNLNNNKIELTREETRIEDLENNILNDKLNLEKIKNHQPIDININFVREEIGKIKSQLEMIGGIDPEIEKEYEETKKRFDFLAEQTDDLNKTIKSLEKVIIELDRVIKDRFEHEFKIISEKFNEYFKILFNGGNAKIFALKDGGLEEESKNDLENQANISNPENITAESQSSKNTKLIKYLKKYNAIGLSGVDISATPPGKKISSINMLSGGERALTAIALICAIISANPSPFVVLDEVDAALDEANSERLAKILDDLSNKTQFIAISHNRATMRKANILYGVTMQNDGVSKLLSVKIDDNII